MAICPCSDNVHGVHITYLLKSKIGWLIISLEIHNLKNDFNLKVTTHVQPFYLCFCFIFVFVFVFSINPVFTNNNQRIVQGAISGVSNTSKKEYAHDCLNILLKYNNVMKIHNVSNHLTQNTGVLFVTFDIMLIWSWNIT